MIKMSKGVRQSNISKSDVARIPIPLIPLQEQTRLVSKISELFSFVDKIEKALEQAIKKG
jgi:type I restriction enzyme, S subunit